MPILEKLDHIHIYAPDRLLAEKWYQEVLGFTRVRSFELLITCIDVISYPVGKFFARLVFPKIKVENYRKMKDRRSWKWTGFTYKKGDQKYFYLGTLEATGAVVVLTAKFIVLPALYRFLS